MIGKILKKSKGTNAQTFYNFLSTVIRSSIAFITMPIFTRLLGAEQYGLYSIYASWLLIATCVMGLNVKASLGTGYYKFKEKYYLFKTSTLIEGTLISVLMIITFFLFRSKLSVILGYSTLLLICLAMDAFSHFVLDFVNISWIYEKHAGKNMILALITLLSTSIISIMLLKLWKNEYGALYYGRVFGTAIPQIIIAIILWISIIVRHPFEYNKEYWKYSFLFGIPMVFHLLSQQVLGQSDRIMMQKFNVDSSEIGIYSFFYSFVAILTTVLGALNNSWCPFLYDNLSNKEYVKLNKKIKNYVQIFLILCIGFILGSREVVRIFASEEYWRGMQLIPILVFVVYVTFIYQFGVNYEIYNSKPRIVAIGTVVAAISNILLNSILIPTSGMYGAAIATLLSYIILAIMHTVVVKTWKMERYPLEYRSVIVGAILLLINCLLFYILADFIIVRWLSAFIMGMYLLYSVYSRKSIF